MKAQSILFSSSACILFAGSIAATPITFDFDAAVDNLDGTVGNIGGWTPTGDITSDLAVTTTLNTTPSIEVTVNETDGFAIVFQNFNSVPEGGSSTPFNQLLEAGGTLSGDAVFTNIVGNSTAQVFMSRQGTNVPFDLTDGDGNFNFTGAQAVDTPFSFTFTLPDVSGTNDLAGGDFYGIGLGVGGNAVNGTTVVFDNLVFTPNVIPEPGTMALFGLGTALVIGGRRQRAHEA
ncbi:MAG: PEP-CTERM sorting domain-containing protein [Planctomycetota bacterium]